MRRFALSLAAAALIGPSPAAADPIYLALGDSSAFGETDRTRNPSNGDRGYVAPLADYLGQARYGGVRPQVLNLAINGETTASFFSGTGRASADGPFLSTNYLPFAPNFPSQRDLYRARVGQALAAGNTVDVVTVQLGANDIEQVGFRPGFLALPPDEQQLLTGQQLQVTIGNYGTLLTELRGVLPAADLYLIGYHNPYAGLPGHPFFPIAAPAVEALNAGIASLAPRFGARYVDFYTPVLGRERELTLVTTFPQDLVNYVHLNDAGYAVVSQQLIQAAAPVPEPASLVVLATGVVGAAGMVRARRPRAAARG